MAPVKSQLAAVLRTIDLGSGVAEHDTLLAQARIETSAFTDMLRDRVDLVPGTKGSGKSALFRIFVEFLPELLLEQKKVVVAHGVNKVGDDVFHAFRNEFETLTEDEFTSFWCIYLVSLAHEHFIKSSLCKKELQGATSEIRAFVNACSRAGIPEIKGTMSLRDILGWALTVLSKWKPRLSFELPGELGKVNFDLFGEEIDSNQDKELQSAIPRYVGDIKETLEAVLNRADLTLWLMIDRLDEVFPRRSQLEAIGLRGLLRAMRTFTSDRIRLKIFIRDDMLEQVVEAPEGFAALTHLTARKADTLRWSEDAIVDMLVKRLFVSDHLCDYLGVDKERLEASQDYRIECFYKVFPSQVYGGPNQSKTHRWIYDRIKDGRDVATPRDAIQLVMRAIQRQQDEFRADSGGEADHVVGAKALLYGLEELSSAKRDEFLRAEFPHLWKHIEKFIGGKTEYDVTQLRKMLGPQWESIMDDLLSIGVFRRRGAVGPDATFWIPHLYRKGLEVTQGKA